MSEDSELVARPRRLWHQFYLWHLFVLTVVVAILAAFFGWVLRQEASGRHARAVQKRIESLAARRPSDMTPSEWESAVAWTLNLHGNSLLRFQAEPATIRWFEQRLAQKLRGDVNMSTIHWIWDEYAEICSGGAHYQRFRRQMEDEIERGGGGWGLNIP